MRGCLFDETNGAVVIYSDRQGRELREATSEELILCQPLFVRDLIYFAIDEIGLSDNRLFSEVPLLELLYIIYSMIIITIIYFISLSMYH